MEGRRYHPHFTQKDTDASHISVSVFSRKLSHGICVMLLTEYLNASISLLM